jgi:tRNA threonylcarbamoyladenosine biosynthesis protein TsaE
MTLSGRIDLVDARATEALGRQLADVLQVGDVVSLSGALGMGKTTFARGVLEGLGLEGEAPSPSFPIVIAYEPPELRMPLWHIDLYRVDDSEELEELGLDEGRAVAVLMIEWPERMGPRSWADALRLTFCGGQNGGRCLTWEAPTAWEGRWPPARS